MGPANVSRSRITRHRQSLPPNPRRARTTMAQRAEKIQERGQYAYSYSPCSAIRRFMRTSTTDDDIPYQTKSNLLSLWTCAGCHQQTPRPNTYTPQSFEADDYPHAFSPLSPLPCSLFSTFPILRGQTQHRTHPRSKQSSALEHFPSILPTSHPRRCSCSSSVSPFRSVSRWR